MSRVSEMGTKRDVERRDILKRHDDVVKRTKVDSARKRIYNQGRNVNSVYVERLLKGQSLVPTRVSPKGYSAIISIFLCYFKNAFSDFCVKLPIPRTTLKRDLHFFLFAMLVVDFMHEWELGVWKALLIHLLRLVTAYGAVKIQTLDLR